MSPVLKRTLLSVCHNRLHILVDMSGSRNVKASSEIELYLYVQRGERETTFLSNTYFLESSSFLTTFQTNEQ